LPLDELFHGEFGRLHRHRPETDEAIGPLSHDAGYPVVDETGDVLPCFAGIP